MNKATFVPIRKERFKYVKEHIHNSKRFINSLMSRILSVISQADFKSAFYDISVWLVEVCLYGIVTNLSSNYFASLPFTMQGIVSHGIVVKMVLMIIAEIKHGTPTKPIFKKTDDN